jgi:carboxypeptidase C (cathepsin A)
MDVYMKFLFDWMKEYDKALPAMLDEGINILIYAGDADFICNWMGNLAWVEDMEWAGKVRRV